MASAVRQITSVGGDIRKIARLLQKKAPPGHMLAYINQEEADLLKAREALAHHTLKLEFRLLKMEAKMNILL